MGPQACFHLGKREKYWHHQAKASVVFSSRPSSLSKSRPTRNKRKEQVESSSSSSDNDSSDTDESTYSTDDNESMRSEDNDDNKPRKPTNYTTKPKEQKQPDPYNYLILVFLCMTSARWRHKTRDVLTLPDVYFHPVQLLFLSPHPH